MDKTFRWVAASALAVILLLGGFAGGLVAGRVSAGSPTFPALEAIAQPSGNLGNELQEVQGILDKQALKPPNEASATAGAINGLIGATGDKYAMYFDAKHYQYFNETNMGQFGGIGVSLGDKGGQAYIVSVYPNTPASKAGMKPGDVFVTIDGVTRDKWTTDEVVKRVRGNPGTKVALAMKRKGSTKPITFELTRAMIKYPNVEGKLYGSVGYIRMAQFNAESAADTKAQIQKLSGQGAKAFILDLRDNPGGLLDAAVDVSSLFVKDGSIVKVEERGKLPVVSQATGGMVTDAPLVVLMNDNSASASEITAGALQDYGRATLIGVKSFGKGSVQTVQKLAEGGAIKFTIAHYLTPKGRAIDGKGLQPDILVKMAPEKQAKPATDTQLQRALAFLRAKVGQ